jgi:hypothetical protein
LQDKQAKKETHLPILSQNIPIKKGFWFIARSIMVKLISFQIILVME